MADHVFSLKVLSEKEVIFFGECQLVFVPGQHDTVAIMAHHTPLIMKMGAGDVMIQDGRVKRVLATVQKGIVYVAEDEVSILVNL